jgi:hypothetical protein
MAYENDNNYDIEYFDITEKIMKLSDELAEDIILMNIQDQVEKGIDLFNDKINYITLYRNKYSTITPDNSFYDKDYMRKSLVKVTELAANLMRNFYSVTLGTDIDYYFPDEYLEDMETIYEFFFVRHFENIVEYFNFLLNDQKFKLLNRYRELLNEETHKNDIFVQQAKKKFKDNDDVVIMHFLNEIIDDLLQHAPSAFVLFDTIANIDPYEETNSKVIILLENYGNKIVFEGDKEAYDKYTTPLKDQEIRNELRNRILMKYLEDVELL